MNQGDCPLNLELGQFHLHLVGKKYVLANVISSMSCKSSELNHTLLLLGEFVARDDNSPY